MSAQFTEAHLRRENEHFSATAGISEYNHRFGFLPAFRDNASGKVYLSRFVDGRRAPVHVLDGLPKEVVTQRTSTGAVQAIRDTLVSGFLRAGRFYTRAEAERAASGSSVTDAVM